MIGILLSFTVVGVVYSTSGLEEELIFLVERTWSRKGQTYGIIIIAAVFIEIESRLFIKYIARIAGDGFRCLL